MIFSFTTYLSPLANHLWQSTIFTGLISLLAVALRKNRAAVRYWLWLAASVKFLIPFALLVSIGSQFGWHAAPVKTQHQFDSVMDQVAQPFATRVPPPLFTYVPPSPSRILLVLISVWFAGFSIAGVAWLRGWRQIRRVTRDASPSEQALPIDWMPIPVRYSPAMLEPCVFGIFRPVLLLPEGITNRLTPDQLKTILIHEMSHVRRRDNLWATVHTLVETLFWFHPLIWWIGKRLMDERECACDEEVLRIVDQAGDYAEGILNVCKFCLESPITSASGVTGSNLRRRIENIMANHRTSKLNSGKKFLVAATGSAALVLPIIIGVVNAPPSHARQQTSTRPQFEVASVRRNNSGSQNSLFLPSPGRFRAENMSVQGLVRWAYNVQPFQIVGGPKWIDSDHYDIDAKIEAKPEGDNSAMQFMVQALLQDRFKLALHREAKELPVYLLTVAKDGPKLKAGTCVTREPNTPLAPGQRQSDFCGFSGIGKNNLRMTGTRMDAFTGPLETVLGRKVIDKTGFAGTFDVSLRWTPEQIPSGTPTPGTPAVDPGGPSIFTAIQEQLGLKLESGKGPVDVLVVDHLESPTEN